MKASVDVKNAQATEKTRGSDMVAEGMMEVHTAYTIYTYCILNNITFYILHCQATATATATVTSEGFGLLFPFRFFHRRSKFSVRAGVCSGMRGVDIWFMYVVEI